jgi:hypothetical protein
MLTSSTFVLILLETLCGHFVLLSLAEKLIFLSKNFKLTLLFRSQERFKKFHVKNSATSTRNRQDIKKYKRRQMCNLRASFQFYQKTDHCQQGSRSFTSKHFQYQIAVKELYKIPPAKKQKSLGRRPTKHSPPFNIRFRLCAIVAKVRGPRGRMRHGIGIKIRLWSGIFPTNDF